MSKVEGKSKIAKLKVNRPIVSNCKEKEVQQPCNSNNIKSEQFSKVTSSVHNQRPLFHNSKQDECLMITALKIEEARKTGHLKLNNANLSSSMFIIIYCLFEI